jgi:D-alanyl-D-alanine carboxypeptidase
MIRILQAFAEEPLLVAALPVLQITGANGLQQVDENPLPSSSPAAKGFVISGKSGTMNYAAGLAGLATAADGHRFAYAIFVNDPKRRAMLEKSFDPRVLKPDEATRGWTRNARALEAALLRHWFVDLP